MGLEVNAEKTKYMVMCRDENAGEYNNIKTGNKYFQRVELFRCLRTTVTERNSIHGEMKRKLKSGSACYHSLQNLFSSSLLSKNIKIKIYRTVILLVVLYGCETWSFTLSEECRLRVSENRVLRRIFEPKRDEVTGE
jgi:hypothetical protein